MSSNPTIAFFGATGGCANACLVHNLRAGYSAIALVRTPQKLKDQLLAQNISEDVLEKQLKLVQGNALEIADIKKTLLSNGPSSFPSVIVNGLGGAPKMQFSLWAPLQIFGLDNPNICATAAQSLLAALREIYQEHPQLKNKKPHLAFVSTTGISRGPEDVPFGFRIFYHQALHVPHVDKKITEDLYRNNMNETVETARVFSGFTCVRPSLLMGTSTADDAIGLDKVRVGTEAEPVLGYTIKRGDVGHWIHENIVGDEQKRKQWVNEVVILT